MADSFSPAFDSTRNFFAAALFFSRALLFPFPAKAGIQIGSAEYGGAPKISPPRQNKRFLYPADFQYNGEKPPAKKQPASMLVLTKNQIADAIEKAAADIERPGIWCQKDEAKDDTGIGVPTEDLTAVRFCASGMIEHNFARAHGFTNRDDMGQEELMNLVFRLHDQTVLALSATDSVRNACLGFSGFVEKHPNQIIAFLNDSTFRDAAGVADIMRRAAREIRAS